MEMRETKELRGNYNVISRQRSVKKILFLVYMTNKFPSHPADAQEYSVR